MSCAAITVLTEDVGKKIRAVGHGEGAMAWNIHEKMNNYNLKKDFGQYVLTVNLI